MRAGHALVLLLAAVLPASPACRRNAPDQMPMVEPVIVRPGAPGEPTRELPPDAAPAPVPEATAEDVRFMQGMIRHHVQALEMVDLLRTRTNRDDMKTLGLRIAVSQHDEIETMNAWLAERGQPIPMDHGDGMRMMAGEMMEPMPGMLTPAEMAALERAAGPEFDRLFLAGMIRHHEGALAMVEELLRSQGAAQDPAMFDFITHVDADQRMEIARMGRMLGDMQ